MVACRAALEEYTRERVPLDWAATQANLGNALSTLGGRESGTARLRRLWWPIARRGGVHPRAGTARLGGDTEQSRQRALDSRGRESGTARLEEAVVAYRARLEEYSRERVPLDWAATQNNLGTALWILGGRESGTARLEEAVVGLSRGAGGIHPRARAARLGDDADQSRHRALDARGARERAARLEEAVVAYRAALEERTRERVAARLGDDAEQSRHRAPDARGRERGTARLEEAVVAYRAALEERTRERVPLTGR